MILHNRGLHIHSLVQCLQVSSSTCEIPRHLAPPLRKISSLTSQAANVCAKLGKGSAGEQGFCLSRKRKAGEYLAWRINWSRLKPGRNVPSERESVRSGNSSLVERIDDKVAPIAFSSWGVIACDVDGVVSQLEGGAELEWFACTCRRCRRSRLKLEGNGSGCVA